ncbi:MAG: helix-turn-helix domain-containing protein [Actinobacteria bacterium]|nr:helix-turn-helix domain-containing protein [Actinomycetota bacterium]
MSIPNPIDVPALTVDEAADFYGIGRAAAYAGCNTYLATDGAEGIPCIRVGRFIRVPTAAMRVHLGIDRLPQDESS